MCVMHFGVLRSVAEPLYVIMGRKRTGRRAQEILHRNYKEMGWTLANCTLTFPCENLYNKSIFIQNVF